MIWARDGKCFVAFWRIQILIRKQRPTFESYTFPPWCPAGEYAAKVLNFGFVEFRIFDRNVSYYAQSLR